MRKIGIFLLLLSGISMGGEWETFPLRENGTSPVWIVAGPFPNGQPGFHDEGCFGYFKDYLVSLGGEKDAIPKENDIITLDDGRTINWKTAFSKSSGLLDFIEIFGVEKNAPGVAYAFCQLKAPERQKSLLKIRSNDGVRVWFNGQMIHDHHVGRTVDAAEDQVEIILMKGNNPLLVKVDQGGGGWGLSVKVVNEDDKPGEEIITSTFRTFPLKNKIKTVKIKTTPLIQKTPEGERQIINAEIFSGGLKNVVLTIKHEAWDSAQRIFLERLDPGKQIIELKVPVIKKTGPAEILVQSLTDNLELKDVILHRARPWTVYLVQHVHTDIGYTRPQTEILPEHLRFIDYALDFCDLTDNFPDDAKFRWTCEVSWPVREFLKRRPPQQIERLKKRVKEGRIEIAGMFLNMSELSSESALAASLQPIKEIKQSGLPVYTAMQNDVNGIGWCLVDYFSDIGIKYVSMGINETRSILPFDQPTAFWWQSPSGKQVLAHRADHYHVGNYWKLHDGNMDFFKPGLLEYIELFEEKNYPFDQIVVNYSGYHTDNSPPSTAACNLVKIWNETYTSPRLRIATAHEFLQFLEKHHAKDLPVYRVAWPDWWTDGFGSAARETAEARITQNALQVSQGLMAMASLMGAEISPESISRTAAVQDALLFYQEHTFGSSESITNPMSENSMIQWGEKSSYVWESVKNEGLLREEALGLLQPFVQRSEDPTIVVYNTLNWQRSGLVKLFIDHEILPVDAQFQILDSETGAEIFAQPENSRSEGTYWIIWVKNIPPLGFRSFRIKIGDGKRKEPHMSAFGGKVLENDYYRVVIDPETGALSNLYDKQLTQELVDPDSPWKMGQFIYERILKTRDFNKEAFRRTGLKNIKIEKILKGPLWKSALLSAETEAGEESRRIKIEYKLFGLEKRIEMDFCIYKKQVEEAEACYVAFPFNLQKAHIVYEAQGGLVTPGVNQLPGSSSDWHTIQNFATVRNPKGQIIYGSKQIPLVQFGDINLGKWQNIAEVKAPYIFSWVMNNYWFTNFRAFQEGEFRWNYFLTSTPDTSNIAATRFGWNSSIPLVARVFASGDSDIGEKSLSTLKIDAENLVLVSARPLKNSIILHLREIEGKSTSLSVEGKFRNKKVKSVDEANVLGETLVKNVSSIHFKPFEVKFLKLSMDL